MIKAIPAETWGGKSTDSKPTENVPDKQGLLEIDTGDVYVFDAEDKKWYKQ